MVVGLFVIVSAALPCGKRHAFLDLGANDGQSLTWFETQMLRQTDVAYTHVTAFELNPMFESVLRSTLRRLPGGTLEGAAAWVEDGTMEANIQLPGSRTAVKGQGRIRTCFDF